MIMRVKYNKNLIFFVCNFYFAIFLNYTVYSHSNLSQYPTKSIPEVDLFFCVSLELLLKTTVSIKHHKNYSPSYSSKINHPIKTLNFMRNKKRILHSALSAVLGENQNIGAKAITNH